MLTKNINEMKAEIPKNLLRLIQNISENLDRKDAVEFSKDVEQAIASDNKDLSKIHYAFLRDMLKRLSERTKTTQDVIDGLDLLANGKEWPEREAVRDAAWDAASADYTGAAAAYYACYAALVADASYCAARAADASVDRKQERELQVTTILELLKNAPILENKNAN